MNGFHTLRWGFWFVRSQLNVLFGGGSWKEEVGGQGACPRRIFSLPGASLLCFLAAMLPWEEPLSIYPTPRGPSTMHFCLEAYWLWIEPAANCEPNKPLFLEVAVVGHLPQEWESDYSNKTLKKCKILVISGGCQPGIIILMIDEEGKGANLSCPRLSDCISTTN